MSRAINIDATPQVVTDQCNKHKLAISAIEPLVSGGTRVVLRTADGAATLRRQMKGQVIEGSVTRSGLYIGRLPAPFE